MSYTVFVTNNIQMQYKMIIIDYQYLTSAVALKQITVSSRQQYYKTNTLVWAIRHKYYDNIGHRDSTSSMRTTLVYVEINSPPLNEQRIKKKKMITRPPIQSRDFGAAKIKQWRRDERVIITYIVNTWRITGERGEKTSLNGRIYNNDNFKFPKTRVYEFKSLSFDSKTSLENIIFFFCVQKSLPVRLTNKITLRDSL